MGLPIGGGFEYLFLIFTPNYLGIFDPNWRIFVKWVGSTTNFSVAYWRYLAICVLNPMVCNMWKTSSEVLWNISIKPVYTLQFECIKDHDSQAFLATLEIPALACACSNLGATKVTIWRWDFSNAWTTFETGLANSFLCFFPYKVDHVLEAFSCKEVGWKSPLFPWRFFPQKGHFRTWKSVFISTVPQFGGTFGGRLDADFVGKSGTCAREYMSILVGSTPPLPEDSS